jgi:hypothetical protein
MPPGHARVAEDLGSAGVVDDHPLATPAAHYQSGQQRWDLPRSPLRFGPGPVLGEPPLVGLVLLARDVRRAPVRDEGQVLLLRDHDPPVASRCKRTASPRHAHRQPPRSLPRVRIATPVAITHPTRRKAFATRYLQRNPHLGRSVGITLATRRNLIRALMIRYFFRICRLLIRHAELPWQE